MEVEYGYIGLFVVSFLAATVIPFSSDTLLVGMIMAKFDPFFCIVVASAGNWLGGLSSYGIGYLGKYDWIEKYLRIKKEKLEKTQHKIAGKELWISLFTWLPGVGDVIAVLLGLLKVNFLNVSIGMLIGKATRYVVWALITINFVTLI